MIIRQLTTGDWKQWKDIRLEALKNSPESFASSYEEESCWQDSEFQSNLNQGQVFGAFVDDLIVSCAGFYSLNELKTNHRGVIWGMYTRPKYRKNGFGTALFQTLIQHAKASISQLHLTCVTNNHAAVAFYSKQGFKIYGTEVRALKINDAFFDEYLMVLDFNENTPSVSIYDLELSLLTPDVRRSADQLNKLIADDFIEFGSSGKIFNKKSIVESLLHEEPRKYNVENFSVSMLSANVMLATYKVTIDSKSSLRSSIWKFENNHWQMVFHQGTPSLDSEKIPVATKNKKNI